MKQELQIFNYKNSQIRTVEQDGQVWFVAKDVCDILELTNAREAIKSLDDDERSSVRITDGTSPKGGNPNVNLIAESGVYALAFKSHKPEAKNFARWVRKEVLPSVIHTGSYSVRQPKEDIYVLAEKVLEQRDEIEAIKPKAEFADRVAFSDNLSDSSLSPAIAIMRLLIALASPTGTRNPLTPSLIKKLGPPHGQSVDMLTIPSAIASINAFGIPS